MEENRFDLELVAETLTHLRVTVKKGEEYARGAIYGGVREVGSMEVGSMEAVELDENGSGRLVMPELSCRGGYYDVYYYDEERGYECKLVWGKIVATPRLAPAMSEQLVEFEAGVPVQEGGEVLVRMAVGERGEKGEKGEPGELTQEARQAVEDALAAAASAETYKTEANEARLDSQSSANLAREKAEIATEQAGIATQNAESTTSDAKTVAAHKDKVESLKTQTESIVNEFNESVDSKKVEAVSDIISAKTYAQGVIEQSTTNALGYIERGKTEAVADLTQLVEAASASAVSAEASAASANEAREVAEATLEEFEKYGYEKSEADSKFAHRDEVNYFNKTNTFRGETYHQGGIGFIDNGYSFISEVEPGTLFIDSGNEMYLGGVQVNVNGNFYVGGRTIANTLSAVVLSGSKSLAVLPLGKKTALGADAFGLSVSADGGLQLFGNHFLISDGWSDTALKVVNNAVGLTSTDSASLSFDYANNVYFRTMPNDGDGHGVYEFECYKWDDDSHSERAKGYVDVRKNNAKNLQSTSLLNYRELTDKFLLKEYSPQTVFSHITFGSGLTSGGPDTFNGWVTFNNCPWFSAGADIYSCINISGDGVTDAQIQNVSGSGLKLISGEGVTLDTPLVNFTHHPTQFQFATQYGSSFAYLDYTTDNLGRPTFCIYGDDSPTLELQGILNISNSNDIGNAIIADDLIINGDVSISNHASDNKGIGRLNVSGPLRVTSSIQSTISSLYVSGELSSDSTAMFNGGLCCDYGNLEIKNGSDLIIHGKSLETLIDERVNAILAERGLI